MLLLHLPEGGSAEAVNAAMAEAMNAAMAEAIGRLPIGPVCSVTWDQGTEMSKHVDFTVATSQVNANSVDRRTRESLIVRTEGDSASRRSPRCDRADQFQSPRDSPSADSHDQQQVRELLRCVGRRHSYSNFVDVQKHVRAWINPASIR